MKTLGIDPGSRILGYGLIEKNGSKLVSKGFGKLTFHSDVEANQRLVEIYNGVKQLITLHKPDHVAIEKVFFSKNVVSALKLGQARGVAILAVIEASIPLFEYSPNAVKQAVVGFGHADKAQVAKMVTYSLGLKFQDFQGFDASDALAIAICHFHSYSYAARLS